MANSETWRRRACLSLLAGMMAAASAQAQVPDLMRALDLNNDGVLDIAEVRTAASARFNQLNPDGDDALLDPGEAAPVMTPEQFRQADKQNRGIITRAEYLAYVERMFLQADPDGDGALYPADLETEQGRLILRLMGY